MPRPSSRHRAIVAALLALQAALVAVDVAAAGEVAFTSAYLTVPLALALVASPRTVAASGVLATALATASGAWNDFFATGDHLVRVAIVAAAGGLAVLSARSRVAAVAARSQADRERRKADAGSRRLDAMLGSLAEAVTVHDQQGHTVYANDAAVRLLFAESVQEILAAEPGSIAARFTIAYEDGAPVAVEDLPGRRAVVGEPATALLTRSVHRASGRASWLLTKATVVEAEDGSPLAVNIIQDVTIAKDREIRQRFLAEAGRALAFSLDPDSALDRIARLAVPVLAEWCTIDLVDGDGELRRGPLVHVDADKVALGRELQRRTPRGPEVAALLAGGPPLLWTHIDDDELARVAADADALDLLRALGMRSAIVAPLRVGDHTTGVLTLVTAESGRAYDADDLAFAEDLAMRIAVAVDNMRLSAERAHAAAALQRSLLPDALPRIGRLRAAASYRPGDRSGEVGGDFYDLFSIGAEAMVLLGDVTGKGIDAAALTALVRHTARTAARFDPRPKAVLATVDEVLRERPALSLVTAVCARLRDTGAGLEVTVASGGHPLPLRVGSAGGATVVGAGGMLLGASPDGEWPETTVELAPGETLLFYTDGATDAPGPAGRFGEERLRRAAAAGRLDPDGLVARVDGALEAFCAGRATDDRALLAVQCAAATLRRQ